jgi:hypothetical protein
MAKSGPKLAKSGMTGMAPPVGPQASQHGSYKALQGATRQGVQFSQEVLTVVVSHIYSFPLIAQPKQSKQASKESS